MKNIDSIGVIAKTVIGALGTTLAYLFGSWSILMTSLLIMNGLDIIVGIMKEDREDLDLTIFINGIKVKVGLWVLLIIANTIDQIAFNGIDIAKSATASVLIAYEALSILRNLDSMGVYVPPFLIEIVEKYKKKKEEVDVEFKDDQPLDK